MPPKQSLDKLLPPILALLRADPPNAYSAHQKALTTTARLVRSGQGALACEILFNVARELLKAGDTASGAELGVRMVEIMGEGGVKVDDKSRGECGNEGLARQRAWGAARPPLRARPGWYQRAVVVADVPSVSTTEDGSFLRGNSADRQHRSRSSSPSRRRGRGARSSRTPPSSGPPRPTVPPATPSCSSTSASCPTRVSGAASGAERSTVSHITSFPT